MPRSAWLLGLAAAAEAAVLAGLLLARTIKAPERASDVVRGERLARASGCFSCHGPGGTGHVPNPGAEGGEVPGFVGGTPMMYVEEDGEIAQYIAAGMPDRLRGDARYLAARERAVLQMPAYGGRLAPGDIHAIAAWVKAASGLDAPATGAAQKGFDLAGRLGCFACHGPMGAGRVANPGSLKGYIPAWTGADFRELARDDREIAEWIETGAASRLQANPAARHFLSAAVIQMPAFRERLAPGDVDSLIALIHALRKD